MSIAFDLIINACIAFTGFYVIARILQTPNVTVPTQVIAGLLGGLLGYLLMEVTVPIENSVYVDLRYLPLLLFAIYGMHLPLVITTLLIASFRFVFGFSEPAVVAFAGVMILGFLLYRAGEYMRKRVVSVWIRIAVLNLISLLISTAVVIVNLSRYQLLDEILPAYLTVGLVTALICSVLTVDLIALHDLKTQHEQSSVTDFLTGIGNTRHWDNEVNAIQKKAVKQPMAVLIFDIDHFKQVNDTHGHDNGDIILKEFSRIVDEHVFEGDVFARIGGEEFVMLMQGKSLGEVETHAETIRQEVEAHEFLLSGGSSLHITVSIGIYYEDDEHRQQSIPTMKFKADQAMYEAKNSGRNRVAVYAG